MNDYAMHPNDLALTVIDSGDERQGDIAMRLASDEDDLDFMAEMDGELFTFTVHGNGNTGSAYIGGGLVFVEWGGDPQVYNTPLDATDPAAIIAAALNDELTAP